MSTSTSLHPSPSTSIMPTSSVSGVLLFRSPEPSETEGEVPEDPYVRHFAEAGYRAVCVPVLSTQACGDAAFAATLCGPTPPSARWSGLVVTSPRAISRLTESVDQWLSPSQQAAWRQLPVYTVGPRSAARLRASGFAVQPTASPHAEALAAAIVEARAPKPETAAPAALPLLFLTGSQRSDVLPAVLGAAGIALTALVIYATGPDPALPAALPAARRAASVPLASALPVQARPSSADDDAVLPVFFSPSGVAYAGPLLGARVTRVAAIGKTTAAALAARWPEAAVVTSPLPAPAALVAAIRAVWPPPGGRERRFA
ncbi:hypothetical protein CXG81DRAFT_26607 [Caulochytrium protostelioides]|uniref:Tetrapyrrole biosynthesis uroporphyrinogen III synthase domain-containing protein n=1 Tax=Caulochytrium protostelioides TaxID=1555241 RepID=A0A4P9X6A5_9FUNG|nr:hypothetical protein CXG81DRAFT_26607 [Caulochytrium protostelioides]|eukprot:RKP00703.1 hypothetical protein CXG81DRAFT_26607 [Caulochytrium protostelioides]